MHFLKFPQLRKTTQMYGRSPRLVMVDGIFTRRSDLHHPNAFSPIYYSSCAIAECRMWNFHHRWVDAEISDIKRKTELWLPCVPRVGEIFPRDDSRTF